jgi:pyrroline-5-carboxylate reductase
MASPLLLIGCGKMGGAMLDGWLDGGMGDAGVQVVEPFAEATKRFSSDARVTLQASVDDMPADFDPGVVVLAVKPQTMDDALAPLSRFVKPGTVFLSIAAGKNISYFESHLGSHAAIVRAMPNTPAAVGRGITAITPNANVSAKQGDVCHKLLESVGEVVAVDREELMDQITALSGGGPAYVFLLIEVMAAAGVKAGLPEELSMQLAKATVAGSGELARQSDDPPSQLRINVTSPGGTTAEALRVLMADDGIQPAFDRAIEAATQRSRELSG